MTLEESLRDMFAAQVESAPAANDPAGVAIRRGNAVRRRRAVLSSLAVAAALVLTVGGVTALGGGWPPGQRGRTAAVAGVDLEPVEDTVEPTPTAPVEPPPGTRDTGIGLDLHFDDQLLTTDGRRFTLTGVGEVTRVYRVPDGWVYAGAQRVRFLRTDGSSMALSGEDDRWVLSGDGRRMAFQVGSTLYLAEIGPTGMAVIADVSVPASTWPVALSATRVVISNGRLGYGVVDLAQPAARPEWNPDLTLVYGAHGTRLTGLVRSAEKSDDPCLAILDITGSTPKPVRSGGCGLDLTDTAPFGRLAPDGSWLAERRAAHVALIRVGSAVAGDEKIITCPGTFSTGPVWADARTVVTGDGTGVLRCRIDGTWEAVPLPAGVPDGWQPVPRLAPATGA